MTPRTGKPRQKPSDGLPPLPNGEQSTPKPRRLLGMDTGSATSKAQGSVMISSGAETSSSEDEVITPARRRQSTVRVGALPANNNVTENDTDDLDNEVADLCDTGK